MRNIAYLKLFNTMIKQILTILLYIPGAGCGAYVIDLHQLRTLEIRTYLPCENSIYNLTKIVL